MCDKCGKRPATTIVRKNINGKYSEYALCSECAGEERIFEDVREMLPSFFSLPNWETRHPEKCPVCGTTEGEIRRTGMAGCATCYKTFARLFTPYVASLHGQVSHKGSIPASAGEEIARKRKIEETRLALREAVRNEEYEKAATLRDELHSLEGTGKEEK